MTRNNRFEENQYFFAALAAPGVLEEVFFGGAGNPIGPISFWCNICEVRQAVNQQGADNEHSLHDYENKLLLMLITVLRVQDYPLLLVFRVWSFAISTTGTMTEKQLKQQVLKQYRRRAASAGNHLG